MATYDEALTTKVHGVFPLQTSRKEMNMSMSEVTITAPFVATTVEYSKAPQAPNYDTIFGSKAYNYLVLDFSYESYHFGLDFRAFLEQ